MVTFAFGIVLGVVVGMLAIKVGQLSLGLGSAGGWGAELLGGIVEARDVVRADLYDAGQATRSREAVRIIGAAGAQQAGAAHEP